MNQMRRMLFNGKMIGILAVVLMLFMAVGVAEEERTDAGGQWKYVLEDGGATITGYVEEPTGDLEIPSELDGYPVTGIGTEAFFGCDGIFSMVIPYSVVSIGEDALYYCEELTSVTIPASVVSIGGGAFERCDTLTLSLAEGSYAVQYAEENRIPYVLLDASGQWKYDLDEDGATIVGYVEEPVGDLAIPSVLDGYPVTGIGGFNPWGFAETLSECTGLTSVTIPGSVIIIFDFSFSYCSSLTRVTIPASVTGIGDDAFWGCEGLTLSVQEGSYAEQYAKENEIPYECIVE